MALLIQGMNRSRSRLLAIAALLAGALGMASSAAGQTAAGWQVEHGVDPPGYAAVDPLRTNLNIDSVVLGCEEFAGQRGLQLQLYLTDDGPFAPRGIAPEQLKRQPRAEIAIDGQVFGVGLLFADDHVVLADETRQRLAVLSSRLLDALQTGRTMVLRFDLASRAAPQPAFDGEAVVDLQAGAGGAAVAAVRRCAGPSQGPRLSMVGRH